MKPSASKARDHEWLDYYERFPYFTAEAVRDDCHPRIMEHEGPTAKAIVLVHGLTDSPYLMTAIGDYFFRNLGYNVYLPLLQCHGLKGPKGMEGVSLDEWKANVNFAVDIAASKAAEVSIGGLSTGGALSFSTAVRNPNINGTVYLFSAALDLAGGLGGVVGELVGNLLGELKERLLRTPVADLVDFFDNAKPLIGDDPYRYVRMDLDGARELSKLIEETDALINGFNPTAPFSKRVFAAHSESDTTADITDIEALQKVSAPGKFTFYRIPKAARAAHVSLVLKEPIYAIGTAAPSKPLVEANPQFQDMMETIAVNERSDSSSGYWPPGGVTVKPQRINAWIAESEADRQMPLIIRQSYTLKLNVGGPHTGSLITDATADVPLSEIPDKGLETVWVVTSDSVELAVAQPDNGVEVDVTDAPASWAATFKLRIPKGGESDTRQLRITPLVAQGTELGIVIFARNTLYRQFRIELKVAEASPPETTTEPSAKVAGDVVHTLLEYTGLKPQHEWQTPLGTLDITVTGNGRAAVRGDVCDSAANRWHSVVSHADWNLPLPKLAGRITNVHDSADKFRTKFSDELNDIDHRDLEERLSHFKNKPDTFWEDNRADSAHTQVWEQKITTSQELFDLAYYGYELYKTFFPDNTKLRLWLDRLEPDWRVNITWLEGIDQHWVAHVPWSLLYVQPPVLGQPVDPIYFWGLRYRFNYLAHETMDTGLSPAMGGLHATASAYGFYWGDDDQELVEEVRWQQAEWAKWGNQMFVPDSKLADSFKQQVLALFNKPPQKPTPVLYCFCHCDVGDGNKPVLRFGKTKDPSDNVKQTDLSQTPFESGPLVFINACTSAASDPYIANELEQTFFERGCRSYLGTEVKVPIRFASRFAKIFYSFFFRDLAPEPIAAGEAVFQARRFLWREYHNIGGLLYAYINMYELYMATESEVKALRDHQ